MTNRPEQLVLAPVASAQGSMTLPGSKSISNRALLLASLAQGRTVLRGVLASDDTSVMLGALRALGIALEEDGDTVVVQGASRFPVESVELFMGNAGTAIRPLTAALAVLGGDYRLSGVARMHERPIGDLVDALRMLGSDIEYLGNPGYPPLHIKRGRPDTSRPVRVRGNVSSQFLTALLMAAPLLTASGADPVVIEVEGELISRPYIQITLNMMARFGVKVERDGWERFTILGGAAYQSPEEYHIEGDASSASYFMALGALGGGPIRISGAGADSIQGDMAFAEVVREMGAEVTLKANSIEVRGVQAARGERLRAFDRDFNLIPDAAMTAAAMALFADGPCTLRNIGSWRVKETDRIDAMHAELAKLGAQVESGPDWLRVHPMQAEAWRSAEIETYDDHRMAMCFSLAAFGGVQVTILDPACVGKTFPEYFSVYSSLVQP